MDAKLAFDRWPVGRRTMASTAVALQPRKGLAFDRSVRSYDVDGRLRVEVANISKAAVNPYVGHEIPGWKELGLEPEKIYQLLRDPSELEKAAPSANGIPVLTEHVAVSADDHQPDLVVGATGTDAEFKAPFLRNSLVLWAKDGIAAVESEEQKELSCAYHYRADMTPGTYDGQSYDGVMRDIVFNHVALVEEGRAGADVVVGDSIREVLMSKSKALSRTAAVSLGALAVYLSPKLAKDAKLDITPALVGLTAKNFKEFKPNIIESLKALTAGKLAQDANLDDVVGLLDKLQEVEAIDAVEGEANSGLPIVGGGKKEDETMDADPMAGAKEFLKGKLSAEDMKTFDEMCAKGAKDATPPSGAAAEGKEDEKDKKVPGLDADPDKDKDKDKDKVNVTKPAMDAAIKAAVDAAVAKTRDDQKKLREAEDAVRPYVGKLAMAHDSADAVYRTALTVLGIKDVEKIDPSAYPALLANMPKAGTKPAKESMAMDAAGDTDWAKRFPGAAAIKVL